MNAMSSSFPPSANEQAALWAARLDGSTLSRADQSTLEAWLAEDPAHRAALAQFRDFSAELDEAVPALVQAGLVAMPATAAAPRRRSSAFLAIGSALAGAAALAAVVWVALPARQSDEIATAVAQRQSITLADGTRIDLNAHTSLQVELGRSERHVRLAGGEAFFAVSKDKSRPFTVDTAAGSVRVTGTAFNVRTDVPSRLEVTVLEGSVQVRPNQSGSPVQLGAGQRLSTGDGGVSVETLTERALGDALAWREGKVVCDGVPLERPLAELARYHGRRITATPAAAGQRLGGRFSLDDLDGFFAALEKTELYQVHTAPDGSVIVDVQPTR